MNAAHDRVIYVAGHRGMVGSAIVRGLTSLGYRNIIVANRHELDLRDQAAVLSFFDRYKPHYVVDAAAKVGGILANNNFPADFIRDNLLIQSNLIEAAHRTGTQRFLFLGSSCIYPKLAAQPLRESYLLSGPLEPTNRPYAVAKIAGIEMCWAYNRQYPKGCGYLAAMPTNLYGPGDNYHPENSHVIPGLLRRFHEAKLQRADRVVVWGSGKVRREFMHVDDMAKACIGLLLLDEIRWTSLLASDRSEGEAPIVNIGCGEDATIADLARLIAQVVGFGGEIAFDSTKPDGTPRKLMDVSKLWALFPKDCIGLDEGLAQTYESIQSVWTESAPPSNALRVS